MPALTGRWLLVLLASALCLACWGSTAHAAPQAVPFSQFLNQVRQGDVTRVTIAGRQLQAVYRNGAAGSVHLPEGAGRLPSLLIQYGVAVEYAEAQDSGWQKLLVRLLPPFLVFAAVLWLARREADRGTGLLTVERNPARLYRPGPDRVTLRDVAGLDEVKEELQEVIDFLQDGRRYAELGARIPRGILLSGPPGTGKTLLARAVAGEAGVPFLTISGSDFVELYAGVGAARVRALFAKARRLAPCVIFIDEIDAVARQRGGGAGGGAEERDQTINQLLVEMDGFTPSEGIIVMASTNRIDILDGAILRPGRFDRQIAVDPPDRSGRMAILAVHARGKPLDSDVDLGRLAAMTTGFTGADLANLLNEAALLAVRRQSGQIQMADVIRAYERVITGGPARPRTISPDGRRRIAYHEAGHALVGWALEGPGRLVKVSILPRGRALGYVIRLPDEDRRLHGLKEMGNRLAALLAGRAAEEIALGEGSTGAADDLERATAMARAMVSEWGMDPGIGPARIAAEPAEQTARAADAAVKRLVIEAYQLARALIAERIDALHRIASALLAHESVDGAALERLIAGEGAHSGSASGSAAPAAGG